MSDKKITLKSLREKYQYDRELRKYSERYYFNDNSLFSRVKTNSDVERQRNGLINTIKIYKEIFPLVQDDIEDVEQAMGRYEISVRKVIQTFDNPHTNFEYSAEELESLIDDIFTQQENVHKLAIRKLFQD